MIFSVINKEGMEGFKRDLGRNNFCTGAYTHFVVIDTRRGGFAISGLNGDQPTTSSCWNS